MAPCGLTATCRRRSPPARSFSSRKVQRFSTATSRSGRSRPSRRSLRRLCVDFTDHSTGRLERSLHPSRPGRRMLAGEVNPSFGFAERLDESDLTWRMERKSAALPRIESPAVREPAFEGLREVRKDLPCLFQRRGHTLVFVHLFERGR